MVDAQTTRYIKVNTEKKIASASNADLLIINFPVAGWYLVSLPITPADSAASSLFPMAVAVFTWQDNAYTAPSFLERGKGYWLAIPEPSAAVIEGTPISQFGGHFTPGWHLIGSVLDTVDFSDPNDDPDGSVLLPIFRWNTAGQRYETTTIEQSHGYWMAVLQETDLVVGGDPSTSGANIWVGIKNPLAE